MRTDFKCSCGEWHEVGPAVAFHIRSVGPKIRVKSNDGIWWVPRVFIAVHGQPNAQNLAQLAEQHKWKTVNTRPALRSVNA